jgi:hypothetical protein
LSDKLCAAAPEQGGLRSAEGLEREPASEPGWRCVLLPVAVMVAASSKALDCWGSAPCGRGATADEVNGSLAVRPK